ncbi:hypothetical protein [Candidatus Cyanaurora vandensis]|uniref:hypothetical protein n=1 Tax=Candidatus Cyanaurora vandensis TaxID=2714958 RepID=UPI00257C5023|nr:hypothetical protein [Candidatus Cyanaurora vandensis]
MSFTLYIVLDQTYPTYLDLAILAEGKRYGVQHLGTDPEDEQRRLTLRVPGPFDRLESYVRDVQIVLQSHTLIHPRSGRDMGVALFFKPDDSEDVRQRLEKLL